METRNKLRQGKDIIVTTPTSSGKSLCFHIPVFETILKNADTTCALYLFPLNALAKDQEQKILQFNNALPTEKRLKIVTLTGETPGEVCTG